MNKKVLIGIGISIAIIIILVGIFIIQVYNPTPTKEQLIHKFSEFKIKCEEKEAEGYDVTEVKEFMKKARQAFNSKDYKTANIVLDNAFEALEKAEEIPPIPEAVKEEAREKLSQVKVASHYRSVTDGKAFNRSIGDVVEIFKETRTDFIVPGWARLSPIPEKCSDLPHGQREKCEMTEYSFEHLRNAVSEIKKEMPNIIFCGALSAEFLNPECWNELTGEKLGKDETWEMALDPSKWGIPMSKEEFQTKVAISHGWTKKGEPYDPKEQMPYYFPDQTNPDYQELFLSWVKKQIDSGVDVIFIDINTKQARVLAGITGDINHIAVEDSFKGASEIADEIHKYGHSKGKNVYVISWATATLLESPYPTPDLDAVMTTLSTEENSKMAIDEAKWETCVKKIKEKIGDIPIFVMFDQGPDYRPLEAFSQGLSKTEQQEMLRRADEFFQRKGLIFIYPIHGGMMGSDERVKVRSYGKFNWYDSLAPEFQTYDTIKELASNKSKE